MPIKSQVDVPASFRSDLDAICKLSRSANIAMPENVISVLILALQSLNAIMERKSAVIIRADKLERLHFVEETSVAWLASSTREKIDLVGERDDRRSALERLNTN